MHHMLQAEIAERLVEFEWPDKKELSAEKLKEIEASVPIPERVWALKNVGATQAMSGPEGRARARQLLERAVSLKRELVGSAKHPGAVLCPLMLELDFELKSNCYTLRVLHGIGFYAVLFEFRCFMDIPEVCCRKEALSLNSASFSTGFITLDATTNIDSSQVEESIGSTCWAGTYALSPLASLGSFML